MDVILYDMCQSQHFQKIPKILSDYNTMSDAIILPLLMVNIVSDR